MHSLATVEDQQVFGNSLQLESIEKQMERAAKTEEIVKKRTVKKAVQMKKKFDSKYEVPNFKIREFVLTRKPRNQSYKKGKSNGLWSKKAGTFYFMIVINLHIFK